MKKFRTLVWVCLAIIALDHQVAAQHANIRKVGTPRVASSDREQDGLNGRVRRVRSETAKILIKDGQPVEGTRVLGGITTYDINGRKIDSVAHPVDSTAPSGREQYGYDDHGNITEMTVRGADGSILTKEVYRYEVDDLGNWTKMYTSVAVFENGKLSFEPVEVTYRTITYYYDESIDKIASGERSKSGSASVSSKSVSPGSPGSVAKSQAKPPAAEVVMAIEPMIVSSDHAIDARVMNEARKNEGQNSVVSAVPVDETATNGNSRKTVEAATSKETTSPAIPDKTPIAPVSGVASYESAQPNKEAPAPVPSTNPIEEKPKAATPTVAISPPPDNNATPARTPAIITVTPAAAPPAEQNQFYKNGLAHLMAGRYAEAVTELRTAVDRNPEDAIAYVKLGLAFAALGQHKETVATLKLAIQINPEVVDVEGYYRLGDSYTALGKRSEAVKALKKAMNLLKAQAVEPNPNKYNGVPAPHQLCYALGLAEYNSENYKEAMREFKQAIDLKPDFAEAHYGVALTYLTFSDLKAAEKEEKILRPLNARLADKVAAAINSSSILAPGSEGASRRSP